MPRCYMSAIVFGALLIVFAILGRLGLADRLTVQILVLVLPILAVTHLYRRSTSCDQSS